MKLLITRVPRPSRLPVGNCVRRRQGLVAALRCRLPVALRTFDASKVRRSALHIALRGAHIFLTKPPSPPGRTGYSELWRERPLNSAWAAFAAPRRGRSRHGSFPSHPGTAVRAAQNAASTREGADGTTHCVSIALMAQTGLCDCMNAALLRPSA